ncbi:hypothetical protein [Kribbella qitaiheensis]|uniref:hypothetical protein n=1 Tax=Kribbella qitaiheensis TaxID=1544730 RepID=UPI0019D5110D|nr:hypothetical protein [Kribbella qitaiheensis]
MTVQTMGTAELGRELGDAGGPLLVAGVATAAALSYGYAALSALLALGPLVGAVGAGPEPQTPVTHSRRAGG